MGTSGIEGNRNGTTINKTLHFWILGRKAFAVVYSLKRATYQLLHRTLDFIPGETGLTCGSLPVWCCVGHFPLHFLSQSFGFRSAAWRGHLRHIPLIWIRKTLVACAACLGSLSIRVVKSSEAIRCSAKIRNRKYFRIDLAAFVSTRIINKNELTATNAHRATTLPSPCFTDKVVLQNMLHYTLCDTMVSSPHCRSIVC